MNLCSGRAGKGRGGTTGTGSFGGGGGGTNTEAAASFTTLPLAGNTIVPNGPLVP